MNNKRTLVLSAIAVVAVSASTIVAPGSWSASVILRGLAQAPHTHTRPPASIKSRTSLPSGSKTIRLEPIRIAFGGHVDPFDGQQDGGFLTGVQGGLADH